MATSTVNIGAAADFALCTDGAVSSSGLSMVQGGMIGGTSTVGFPPAIGSMSAEAERVTAMVDIHAAYNDIQMRGAGVSLTAEIGGTQLAPGLYTSAAALSIASGNLTLNGKGIYIFCIGAAMSVAASTGVVLVNGAVADDVYWQITGAVTAGASSFLVGTIITPAAITLGASATVAGRLFSYPGPITMDTVTVTCPDSAARAVLEAITAKNNILTSLGHLLQFNVELPDGRVVTRQHTFGDSLKAIVRSLIELDSHDLCKASVQWQLVHDLTPVTQETMVALCAAMELPVFSLLPLSRALLHLIEGDTTRVVEFKKHEQQFDLMIENRYTVRFYSKHMNLCWGATDQHVWIDNGAFVPPSALMSTLTGPISIVPCDADTFAQTQLET